MYFLLLEKQQVQAFALVTTFINQISDNSLKLKKLVKSYIFLSDLVALVLCLTESINLALGIRCWQRHNMIRSLYFYNLLSPTDTRSRFWKVITVSRNAIANAAYKRAPENDFDDCTFERRTSYYLGLVLAI